MSGTHYHLILSARQHCPHFSHGSKNLIFLVICRSVQFSILFHITCVLFYFLIYKFTSLTFDYIILCIHVSCTTMAVLVTIFPSAFLKFDLI